MNKFLIATAATFFAIATFFASAGAEAGVLSANLKAPAGASALHQAGCHSGGYGRRTFRRHAIQSVRRAQQKKAYIARQEAIAAKKLAIAQAKAQAKAKAEAAKLAQLEKVEEPVETADAETENSSITTKTDDVAIAPAKPEQKVAVAKELGCKQFFPSVGMTLTVPCE